MQELEQPLPTDGGTWLLILARLEQGLRAWWRGTERLGAVGGSEGDGLASCMEVVVADETLTFLGVVARYVLQR